MTTTTPVTVIAKIGKNPRKWRLGALNGQLGGRIERRDGNTGHCTDSAWHDLPPDHLPLADLVSTEHFPVQHHRFGAVEKNAQCSGGVDGQGT